MKTFSAFLFSVAFVLQRTDARLVGARQFFKASMSAPHQPRRTRSLAAASETEEILYKMNQAAQKKAEHIDFEPVPQRRTSKIAISISNLDVDFLTGEETLFLEDTFLASLHVTQTNDLQDIKARSMIIVDQDNNDVEHGHDGNRNLLFGTYFSIWAFLEWSCHFCGGQSITSTLDDDATIKDNRYDTPTATDPLDGYDSGSVTLDDDYTDDGFYYSGANTGNRNLYSADKASLSLFADRKLEDGSEYTFGGLVCKTLREGPFPVFGAAENCSIVLLE